MATPTGNAKLIWQPDDRAAKVTFAIPYELNLTVETELPGAGARRLTKEGTGPSGMTI
jgi:hypothetical protein